MNNLSTASRSNTSDYPKDQPSQWVSGQYVTMDDSVWYKISNSHRMSPFFMTAVSSGDHWMFVSSRGALTAGRQNPDSALFPYYSADKIVDTSDCTGPKTLLNVRRSDGTSERWEPFSPATRYCGQCTQNLYKNWYGNRIVFEEIHHSLRLAFRYGWTFGERFGFIRGCELRNLDDNPVEVEIVDGMENILPSRLGSEFQLRYSNLADAYKKSERLDDSNLGVYYLSSIPTDRAEPSEGLLATVAWHTGLENANVAISGSQIDDIRGGQSMANESDVRGQRGAYFISKTLQLATLEPLRWNVVADVNYDHCDVIELHDRITNGHDLAKQIDEDVAANEAKLLQILSAADGRQVSENRLRAQRHQSNVLFNVMRGGIPANGYEVVATDFVQHVATANRNVSQRCQAFLDGLPESLSIDSLQDRVANAGDSDLVRLASEYLPLRFSRRHGDPTRPWNKFSIDLTCEDGGENLSYQGNWRDIFQNWEALSVAYPKFTVSMIQRFVNASTADGYNPYRITKDGFDWEVPDPDDPWANIGYWGDHQIVYLLRLLQRGRSMFPSQLDDCLSRDTCVYANVPYRIRSHEEICRDPQNTIDYDFDGATEIDRRVREVGSDGKLLCDEEGSPLRVGLVEKLLVPALAKLSGFVPGGGIWLNTQRPEWNDANNALVGRGLSVVTVCYLRRYLSFLVEWFDGDSDRLPENVLLSRSVFRFADTLKEVLAEHAGAFEGPIDDEQRFVILDKLAMAGSDYRGALYAEGIDAEKVSISLDWVVDLFRRALAMVDHTIRANRRDDGMYHSYNLIHLENQRASVSHLYEMLEGQVAVLSSGLLSGEEAVEVLDTLRSSKIYREDQQSYMLYPNRTLSRYLEKNCVSSEDALRSRLVRTLTDAGDKTVLQRDIHGEFHFNGGFRNAADLNVALDRLRSEERYRDLVDEERERIHEMFEQTFGHRQFTGRSGTFFGYEGLGSIYWHMVSKLALAVMEHCVQAAEHSSSNDPDVLERLHEHYREIRDGIGLTKTPQHYGAFPSDPYSHTPEDGGVRQPGMTGQVKEDILSRWDELGIRIDGGRVRFDPKFFEASEFLQSDTELDYFDVNGYRQQMNVPTGCFAMTLCQVPVIYRTGASRCLAIHFADKPTILRSVLELSESESDSLFSRRGEITQIEVRFD